MPVRILIVDDEPDIEVLIRQRFRKEIKEGDYEFLFAQHGEEALQRLEADPNLDIVMSDINMPVMDGLTLLSRLPKNNRALKAVVLSAYADLQNIRKAMNSGAFDFLTKPIDFRDLDATLHRAIKDISEIKESIQAQEHLTATLKVVTDLSTELQIAPLLQKIIATVTKMLASERSTLFLHDDKKHELYTVFGQGLGRSQIRIPDNMGIAGSVFQSSEPVRITDPYSDRRFNPEVDRQTGFVTRSILCVPVINKQGKTIGVTQVLNKIDGTFTENDQTRLQAFTSQISIALENAKLFDDVQTIKNYNESILESMASGVVTTDLDGNIVTINAAARRILKVTEDILQKKASDFFTGPNEWVMEKVAQVDEDKIGNVTMEAELNFGGDKISTNVIILPLTDIHGRYTGSMIMIEDITTEKRLKSTMSRYMDPAIVDQLMNQDALGGQSGAATVLFSDIRSFTTLTERLGPQDTVTLLNDYFTLMVECVQSEGGMLDKFIGDAFMAEFGIPLPHDDDEDRAVRTAIQMHKDLKTLNDRYKERAWPTLRIGVGINSDIVVSGNIGSPKRMDYTVIGDGVNLAARLEGACKEYGAGILVSEATFRRLKGTYIHREVDRVIVQGKTEPVGIYEILDYYTESSFPNMTAALTVFAKAVQLYRSRNWIEAEKAFSTVLQLHPADRMSVVYFGRCEAFMKDPPPKDWDGVWRMTSK